MTNAVNVAALGSTGVSPGFKNRIINGAMTVNQRGTVNTPVTPANTQYTLDRYNSNLTQAGKYSVQQSTTAPAGFSNSLLMTSLSSYSVISTDFFDVFQPIEGYNIADLNYGTASAKSFTVSFWIRASIAGTYAGYFVNRDGNRGLVFSYSVPSANTWTYITAAIPADTAGGYGSTNDVGIYVVPVSLGCGSSLLTSTTNTWSSTLYRGVTGQVNIVGTSGATVYVTGLQLEVGTTATNFEVRCYGTELALCQRYAEVMPVYAVSHALGLNNVQYVHMFFKEKKRATPTYTVQSGGWQNSTPTGVWMNTDMARAESSTAFYSNDAVNILFNAEL